MLFVLDAKTERASPVGSSEVTILPRERNLPKQSDAVYQTANGLETPQDLALCSEVDTKRKECGLGNRERSRLPHEIEKQPTEAP